MRRLAVPFSIVAFLFTTAACDELLSGLRVEVDYVAGSTDVDSMVQTIRGGVVIDKRLRKVSDQLRENWVYSSSESWQYSEFARSRVYSYLQEHFSIPVGKFGRREVLPGFLVPSRRNQRNQEVLLNYYGTVPSQEDSTMPGVPVSKLGSTQLYLFSPKVFSTVHIASDSGFSLNRGRDSYDSIFTGLRNEMFGETNDRIYFSINAFAKCYDPVTKQILALDSYDNIAPVIGSSLLIGYSFGDSSYTLLDSCFVVVKKLKGPEGLEIRAAHLLDSTSVVIIICARKNPAFLRKCYLLDFSSGSFTHILSFESGEILAARKVGE